MNYFEDFGYSFYDDDVDLPAYDSSYIPEYDNGRKAIDWLFRYCNEHGYFSQDEDDLYLAVIPKDKYKETLEDIKNAFPYESEAELRLLIKNNIGI